MSGPEPTVRTSESVMLRAGGIDIDSQEVFLSGDMLCGHQIGSYSGRLDLVAAVIVLVSSLVSTWCPNGSQN